MGTFQNLKVYIVPRSVDDGRAELVRNVLRENGARLSSYLTDSISILIADNGDSSEVGEARDIYDIPVVSSAWVLASSRCGFALPYGTAGQLFSPEKCLIFAGLVFCPSQIARHDANILWTIAISLGAECDRVLTERTTHLICTSIYSEKYQAAMGKGNVRIVLPQWLIDSARAGERQDESKYHPAVFFDRPPSAAAVTAVTPSSVAEERDSHAAQAIQNLVNTLKLEAQKLDEHHQHQRQQQQQQQGIQHYHPHMAYGCGEFEPAATSQMQPSMHSAPNSPMEAKWTDKQHVMQHYRQQQQHSSKPSPCVDAYGSDSTNSPATNYTPPQHAEINSGLSPQRTWYNQTQQQRQYTMQQQQQRSHEMPPPSPIMVHGPGVTYAQQMSCMSTPSEGEPMMRSPKMESSPVGSPYVPQIDYYAHRRSVEMYQQQQQPKMYAPPQQQPIYAQVEHPMRQQYPPPPQDFQHQAAIRQPPQSPRMVVSQHQTVYQNVYMNPMVTTQIMQQQQQQQQQPRRMMNQNVVMQQQQQYQMMHMQLRVTGGNYGPPPPRSIPNQMSNATTANYQPMYASPAPVVRAPQQQQQPSMQRPPYQTAIPGNYPIMQQQQPNAQPLYVSSAAAAAVAGGHNYAVTSPRPVTQQHYSTASQGQHQQYNAQVPMMRHPDVRAHRMQVMQQQQQQQSQAAARIPMGDMPRQRAAAYAASRMPVPMEHQPQQQQQPSPALVDPRKTNSGHLLGQELIAKSPPVQYFGHDRQLNVPPELCLIGCVFFIVDYERTLDAREVTDWRTVIEQHGGEIEQAFDQRCTHLICESLRNPVVQQALKENRRCVTAQWLNDCIACKKLLPPWKAVHFPSGYGENKPCKGRVFCSSGFTAAERNCVKQMVAAVGARYTTYFSRRNHLLIAKTLAGRKVAKAAEWKVAVVNLQWLTEVFLGQTAAIQNIGNAKYRRFFAKESADGGGFDPFRIDTQLMVPVLMNAWRTPIVFGPQTWKLAANKRYSIEHDDGTYFPYKRIKLSPPPPPLTDGRQTCAWPSEGNSDAQVKICFTGFYLKEAAHWAQKAVKLGAAIVSDVRLCTHLVTVDLKRTRKLLEAIACGRYVVTAPWIGHSYEQRAFVDPLPFLAKDEGNENFFGFNLKLSLFRARRRRLFDNLLFYVTPSVQPLPSVLNEIIRTAGGLPLSKWPSLAKMALYKKYGVHFVVIACENDLHLCQKLLQAGIDLHSAEFVLTGILRQELDMTCYKLEQP